ncbi:MAG: phosphoadenosine phosphosulfate reductase [Oscillospiraceae bacterium]
MNKCIAEVSWGRDSLGMLLYILEHPEQYPLDEVVFYNTGMEFGAIYALRDQMLPLLQERGIAYTELHPDNTFLYDMLERPVESKQKGKHNGYGWCGGRCRWGTTWKTQALDRHAAGAVQYIGIAADEAHRRAELTGAKRSPLIEQGMTEADCLQYCRDRGYTWTENGVDLYDILDRVSCWCCCNKNLKELRNIWRYLPEYWERLINLQERIERPFKKYKNRKYGEYGDLRTLQKIFEQEEK